MSSAAAIAIVERSPGQELGNKITELCGYMSVAAYQFLVMIREFDTKRYWEEQGFRSCSHWMNFHCGLGLNSARERLRVAYALGTLPRISEKFAKGQLSYSMVRAMTRVADSDNEDYLLMVAEHGTTSHMERLVRQYRRACKLQNPDVAYAQYQSREMSYYYDDDGSVVMKVKMPAERGELVLKALEKMMDEDFREESGKVEGEERLTAKTRRADALLHIAESYLNGSNASGSAADRYQVFIHKTAHSQEMQHGPHVSAETCRRVTCDCSTANVVEDEHGEPLSIGRRSRTIPPAIKRALVVRDGGCRFPGCTNCRYVVGHHIQHWSDGGGTSLDNLVLLCDFHHHLVHEGGFDCRKSDGEIYFADKRDERLAESFKPRPISIENSLAWMRQTYPQFGVHPPGTVSAETSVSGWKAGERMDTDYAVSLMF